MDVYGFVWNSIWNPWLGGCGFEIGGRKKNKTGLGFKRVFKSFIVISRHRDTLDLRYGFEIKWPQIHSSKWTLGVFWYLVCNSLLVLLVWFAYNGEFRKFADYQFAAIAGNSD